LKNQYQENAGKMTAFISTCKLPVLFGSFRGRGPPTLELNILLLSG